MTKAKKPVRRGAAVNHRAPKKATKRKPIPSQVADGALQARADKAKPGLIARIWRVLTNREKASP